MEARLESTLRTIPWWLTLKAAIFGAAWLLLPFWLFFLLALALYFFPLFEPGRLAVPLLSTLFFTWLLTPNLWAAVFLGLLFFFILGIKDLIFIHRFPAYEALIFLLFALAFLNFFAHFDRPNAPGLLPGLGLLFLFFALLYWSFLRYGERSLPGGIPARRKFLTGLLALFLLGEWLAVLVFLPLNFFLATALLLLGAVSLVELLWSHAEKKLTCREILVHFSAALVFLTIVLAANSWKI